jgi:hypothetical protein
MVATEQCTTRRSPAQVRYRIERGRLLRAGTGDRFDAGSWPGTVDYVGVLSFDEFTNH